MAVLYRKYRPQTFAEMVGQKFVIQTLQNQVSGGQLAHAYLFTGSRGVGKTSVARILAKAVNCEENKKRQSNGEAITGDACGICAVCKQIEAGNFMDLVEIDAASNTGVDNIRELIEHVKFSPSSATYKVFIIDEVHMLSKGAFNALLKTLEEPPNHAIFILATTEINKVPATIISRTQRFDFKRLSDKDLAEHLHNVLSLEKLTLADGVVELIAANSDGSVRDSLSLLDKVLSLGGSATLSECTQILGVTDLALSEQLVELIGDADQAKVPEFFFTLAEKGVDIKIFNRDFLEYLRKLLVFKATAGADFSFLEGQHAQALKKLSDNFSSLGEIIFVIRLFLKSFKDLSDSPDPTVPLLIAALEASVRQSKTMAPKIQQRSEPVRQPIVSSVESGPAADLPDSTVAASSAVIVEESFDAAGLEDVKSFWPKVVDKIKDINTPLSNMVWGSELMAVEDGQIILGVKFLFHKQSLEQQKNRHIICESIKAVSGKNLGVKAVVQKPDKPDISPVAALGEALQIFGGELVE